MKAGYINNEPAFSFSTLHFVFVIIFQLLIRARLEEIQLS